MTGILFKINFNNNQCQLSPSSFPMKRKQQHYYLSGRLEKLYTIDRDISLLEVSSLTEIIIIVSYETNTA